MILVKNGDKRVLTDIETIKMFKDAGWTELEIKKPEIKEVEIKAVKNNKKNK